MQYTDLTWNHLFKFDSITDMVENTLQVIEERKHLVWTQKRIEGLNDSQWIGRSFDSFADVAKAVNQPWEEGLQIIDQMLDKLHDLHLPVPQSRRRVARWNEDHGDDLDIDRLRAGQPYWRSSEREIRTGPQNVTIIAAMGATQNWHPMQMIWRGAAAIVLTELLERAGYRVDLWGGRTGTNVYTDKSWQCFAVQLKRPEDPLDRSAVVNAVSGWFYRTIGICTNLLRRKGQVRAGGGSSAGCSYLGDMVSQDENTFFAEWIWSEQTAMEWIRTQVDSMNPNRPEPKVEAKVEEVVEETQTKNSGSESKPTRRRRIKIKIETDFKDPK